MNTISLLVIALLSQAGNPQPSGASAGFPIRNGMGSGGGTGGGTGGGAGGGGGSQGSGDGGLTFFTFADGTDAGLTDLCACQPITTVQGHPVTWVRGGIAAYCLKNGYVSTGISNTDAVMCDGGLPRVVLNSFGSKGVWEEALRSNVLYQTQEFGTAPWAGYNGGGAGGVSVSADQATGPDGTLTADRITVSSCSGANSYSQLGQVTTSPTGVYTAGVFIKGMPDGGFGSINALLVDGNAGAGAAIQCSFVSGSWSWCGQGPNKLTYSMASTNVQFFFGCNNQAVISGSTNTGSAEFFAWQADVQNGYALTSPIRNIASLNTRQADDNYIALNNSNVSTTYSMAGSSFSPTYSSGVYYPTNPRWSGSWSFSPDGGYLPDGGGFIEAYPYLGNIRQASSNYAPLDNAVPLYLWGGVNRISSWYDGTTLNACTNGFCTSATQAMIPFDAGVSFFHLGTGLNQGSSGQQADGIITNVCASENAAFCR